ncbi:MAG: methyltransferase domain-containing protein [Deltaproteobacteria bacterium]|nr:methyltransferase domain-containing protein [Deltaproteobacteria bacterium]
MLAFRKKYLEDRKNEPLSILDLGSLDVNGSYRDLFQAASWTYRGIDTAPGKNVDIVLRDPYDWREIRSGSADVVISGQAFEHIEFFWMTMLEIARILKPEGLCCIIAPSGGPEHRYPVDCWRFYPDGFSALARFASLEVLEIYSQTGSTGYADGSDLWRDTVLVCKKATMPSVSSWKRYFKVRLLRKLLRGADRKSR